MRRRDVLGLLCRMVVMRAIAIALVLVLGAYSVMALANLWPLGNQCDWQFPKVLSCLLGVRENLAGGVLGAAGALMAAWLAWVAIQKQISAQQRANLIADLTFWQRKYDNALIAMRGLQEVNDIANRCFQIFGTARTAPSNDPTPYSKAVRAIEREGLLAAEALPVTGSNLIAFRMARLRERLRHQHSTLTKHADPTAELAIKDIETDMETLVKEIPLAVKQTQDELREADLILSALKRSSDYPKTS